MNVIPPQPVNCLFLHLFVAKDGYHQSAIAELLKTAFISLPLLHFVFLACPAETQLGPVLSAHFTPVPLTDEEMPSTHLWVTQRHQHFPVLHVRTALVEDADDLMPIFERCCAADVHEQYGERAPLIISYVTCYSSWFYRRVLSC